MQFSFQFFTLISSSVFALAPLEPVDGSPIYIGAWWDRLNQQTPNSKSLCNSLTHRRIAC